LAQRLAQVLVVVDKEDLLESGHRSLLTHHCGVTWGRAGGGARYATGGSRGRVARTGNIPICFRHLGPVRGHRAVAGWEPFAGIAHPRLPCIAIIATSAAKEPAPCP